MFMWLNLIYASLFFFIATQSALLSSHSPFLTEHYRQMNYEMAKSIGITFFVAFPF